MLRVVFVTRDREGNLLDRADATPEELKLARFDLEAEIIGHMVRIARNKGLRPAFVNRYRVDLTSGKMVGPVAQVWEDRRA